MCQNFKYDKLSENKIIDINIIQLHHDTPIHNNKFIYCISQVYFFKYVNTIYAIIYL